VKLFKLFGIMAMAGALVILPGAKSETITPPAQNETVKSVLSQIQARVNAVSSMHADLEYDQKDKGSSSKKKKNKDSKKSDEKATADEEQADEQEKDSGAGRNMGWPEPEGRDVERGPIIIKRGVGAYLKLERKKKVIEYIANSSQLWKYDHKHKEARLVPSSWPIVNTFVQNALQMNVFVAMDSDTIKYRGTETIDGVPCWVLEGKSPSKLAMVGAEQVKLKLWISQTDGIPRMIKVPGKDDSIIRLKNVQTNVAVDESKFSFTPPAGVKTKNILGF